MQNVSYYRESAEHDNACSLTTPLQVNCCGVAALSNAFTNHSPQGREDYYFLYMAEGALEFHLKELHTTLRAGDLVIIPPRTPFSYSLRGGEMAYYWVHFTGAQCDSLLAACSLPVCTILHPGSDPQAHELLGALHRAFYLRAGCFEAESCGLLSVLFSRLSRLLSSQASPSRLQTSLEYIHRHYAEPLTVQALAAMEFLSPSRFTALFRRQMGASPQQYLISLRMQTARELIRSTDMPVKQVAAAVGYQDQLYFSRLFHRTFGHAPVEEREGTGGTPGRNVREAAFLRKAPLELSRKALARKT